MLGSPTVVVVSCFGICGTDGSAKPSVGALAIPLVAQGVANNASQQVFVATLIVRQSPDSSSAIHCSARGYVVFVTLCASAKPNPFSP